MKKTNTATRPRLWLVAAGCLLLPALSSAQVTLKPDGKWRYLFSAGANASSGNSKSTSLNVTGEAARVTDYDKWTFLGQTAYATSGKTTTTERAGLGTLYNRDLSPAWFGFGSADLLRDRIANIDARYSLAAGFGRHLVKNPRNTFDVSAGLGYTEDRFVNSAFVGGLLRDSYGRAELVLAEESNHTLTGSTSLRQRLAIYPNLTRTGDYRGNFDTNVTVEMTKSVNLTAGLSYRFNSDPGIGLKKGDLAFVTGVSFRFD